MLEEILKQIVAGEKNQGWPMSVILNSLKEYVQYIVLSKLYNEKKYKRLVFKGGSCLRMCFGLPRLSEDIDFDYDPETLGGFSLDVLENFLKWKVKSVDFDNLETKVQSDKRLYLKFPVLKAIGAASPSESDKLYVKLEIEDSILPYSKTELTPISKFGFNFIVLNYDLPTLMVGKINAFFERLWFKGEKNEIDIKGRDFYDLFWFLQKGVVPNWKCLRKTMGIDNEKQLKERMLERINKVVTSQKLNYDLRNFLPDQEFVADFSKNYREIIKKYL